MSAVKLSFKPYFPLGALIVGAIFLVLGFFAVIDENPAGLIIGPIFFIIGFILSFSFKGSRIDYERKRFLNYFSFLGIPFGDWKSYNEFPFITVLEIYMRHESGSQAQRMIINSVYHDYLYRVCFLSVDHRQKVLLFETKNKDQAFTVVRDIAEKTEIKLTTYNPPTSAKKRRR